METRCSRKRCGPDRLVLVDLACLRRLQLLKHETAAAPRRGNGPGDGTVLIGDIANGDALFAKPAGGGMTATLDWPPNGLTLLAGTEQGSVATIELAAPGAPCGHQLASGSRRGASRRNRRFGAPVGRSAFLPRSANLAKTALLAQLGVLAHLISR